MSQVEIADCGANMKAVFLCTMSYVVDNQKMLLRSGFLKWDSGITINRRWVVVF
jgi:hypothetical protein